MRVIALAFGHSVTKIRCIFSEITRLVIEFLGIGGGLDFGIWVMGGMGVGGYRGMGVWGYGGFGV